MKRFKIENEQLNCDVKYIEYGCDEKSHVHDGIEIIYIVAGRGENVNTDILNRICLSLNCSIADIVEVIPEGNEELPPASEEKE